MNIDSALDKIISYFKQAYSNLYSGNADFSVPFNKKIIDQAYIKYSKKIEGDDTFIASFGRSSAQFYCQSVLRSKMAKTTMELLSAVALPFCLIFWYLKSWGRETRKTKHCDGVKFIPGKDGPYFEIPDHLKCYKIENYNRKSGYLTNDDIRLVRQIILFAFKDNVNKFKFLFLIKIFYNLSTLRRLLDTYEMSFCCFYMEYNFSSSVLTWYLNSYGIKAYNIMHGEKFYYCRDAFVSFNRFYVWNSFYADQFKIMYANADYIIFQPGRFSLNLSKGIKRNVGIIFPSMSRDEDEMSEFIEMIKRLSSDSRVVSLRFHPSYIHIFNRYRELLPQTVRICNPHEQSIRAFLDENDIIIGFYSTVLVEAAMNGRYAIYIKDKYCDAIKDYYFIFKHNNVSVRQPHEITLSLLNTLVPEGTSI